MAGPKHAKKDPKPSIQRAAAVVRVWMSNQHLVEKMQAHFEVERMETIDPAHWHLKVYSRLRGGPTYHVRKGNGFSTYAASLTDPYFGTLVCALLNAYEAITGEDVVLKMRG